MSEQILLVEIDGFNTDTGAVETLRFCDGLAYRLRPSEVPANALYRPFVKDPGWSRVDVFTGPGQYGHITPGECVLDDSSGEIGAHLIKYAFDGRRIVVRTGLRGAPYPAGFVTVINGTMARAPMFGWGQITFVPADLTAAQAKTLQTVRFSGSNVLPNGVEGLDDLLGKVKPLVFALASNMTPVLCNTSKLIYQVSTVIDAGLVAVSAVRDGGVPLTLGAAYTSVADMLATGPAANSYRVLSTATEGCYIRLGSSPVKGITCDAAYGASADRTHAQAWRRVLTYSGVSGVQISDSDIAALDAALPAEIEFAVFDETNADSALSVIANSAAAAWYGDPSGIHRLVQWAAPSGAPVATLTSLRTDTMGIDDPVGNDGVAPAYLVSLSYGRNWTPQKDADLNGDKTSASDNVRAPGSRAGLPARVWLESQYRVAIAIDTDVLVRYRNAVKLELTSLISAAGAAQAFADTLRDTYKVARQMTSFSGWLSDSQINVVRPGTVVLLRQERWNYGPGRLMRVAGVQIDRRTKKTELTCWG
ncbi:hypothetical protein ACEN9F_13365 [Duganella sp. CT11-25]|uniref:hypothetical protein n=1 Tax=unclassified Duganella TaxID=2636909 RepID=UPI0039AF062F